MVTAFIVWLVWLGAVAALALLTARAMLVRRRASARIFAADREPEDHFPTEGEQSRLARWLFVAGFRGDRAVATFVGLTVLGAAVGAGVFVLFYSSGTIAKVSRIANRVPGGVGEVFLPVIDAAPWLALAMCAARRRSWCVPRAAAAYARWNKTCPSCWSCWPRWLR